ncbi:MAG: YadA-like family protein [Caecibacter massiliensis]|nr:YadA-like family protein [Caecibacter massiliensis]
MAIGKDTKAVVDGAIALGTGSQADRSGGVTGWDPKTGTTSVKTGTAWQSGTGALSIGNGSASRQITHVAAGSEDSDAVNLAQLKEAMTHYYSVKTTEATDAAGNNNYLNDGASGDNALAAGVSAVAAGNNATAVGTQTYASGEEASAYGYRAAAMGKDSVSIGSGTSAQQEGSIAIGGHAQGDHAVQVGTNSTAQSAYSVAVGGHAKGDHSVEVGYGSTAQGSYSASVGGHASGDYSIAIGSSKNDWGDINPATAGGDNSIAIGGHTNSANDIAIGAGSGTSGGHAIAVGGFATSSQAVSIGGVAGSSQATAVGSNSSATGAYSTAVGGHAGDTNSTAVGQGANATYAYATAVGNSSTASGSYSTALGYGTSAQGSSTTAIGGANANGTNLTVIGKGSTASASSWYDTISNSTAIGSAHISASDAAAIGSNATVNDKFGVALGHNSNVSYASTGIGAEAKASNTGTAVGYGAQSSGYQSAAVGAGSNATGQKAVSLGGGGAWGDYSIALGSGAGTTAHAIALGQKSGAWGENAIAIGEGTNAWRANSIVLGKNSKSGADKNVEGYDPLTGMASEDKSAAWYSTDEAVSFGRAEERDDNDNITASAITRQLNNVAAGILDTDAVNVAQLKASGFKVTAGKDEEQASAIRMGDTLDFEGEDNAIIATSKDSRTITVKVSMDPVFNSVTADKARMGYSPDGVLDTVQNGQPTGVHAPDGNYVTGLTNKEWTVDAPTYVSGRAATEDELRIVSDAVSGNTTTIENNTKIINKNTETINSGLSFTTNTKDAANTTENYKGYKVVKRSLGDTIAIKASDETGGHSYSTSNLTTRIAENGDISILMDEKPSFTTVTTGDVIYTGNPDRKDKDGKAAQADTSVHYGDKTLTDGQNITTSDHETKSTRLGYKDAQDKRHDIATLDDGQIYAGDITSDGKLDENGFARTMNQKTTINGGVTNKDNLTDNNIGVVSNGTDTLTVKLAKELKDLTSVTTGKTVQDDSGIKITNSTTDETKNVVINGDKISYGGNQVTNMGSGINTATNQYDTLTNGANIGDVKNIANNTTEAAKLTGDSNITVTYNDAAAGGKNTVKLNDSITLGSDADKKVTIDGTEGTITAGDKVSLDGSTGKGTIGGVTIGNQTGVTTTKMDGDKAKTEDGTFVTGLSNKTWNPDSNGIVSGRAATEDQLKTVSDTVNAGWELDVNGTKQKAVTPTSPKVNFVQGQNITISGSGDNVTVATEDDVRFASVRVGGDTGGIVIGQQSGLKADGNPSANPNVDYYITGLKNTNWDSEKIQSGRAATEDQLKIVADEIKNGTVAGDVFVTGGGIKYNGEHDASDTTSVNDGKGSLKLTLKNQDEPLSIDGLHDYYAASGTVSADGKTLTIARNEKDAEGNPVTFDVDLTNLLNKEKHLIANPADGSQGVYKVNEQGEVTLQVQDAAGNNTPVTISGLDGVKGLNFDANTKKTSDGKVHNVKLGGTIKVQGVDPVTGHDYSADNVTTEVDDNGNITIKLDKALTADTVMVNGKDGRDGQIGLNGKDGKDGTVTTIIRTIGKNGTDGTDGKPGVNGTDGITRIVYQDGKDGEPGTTTHTVATLDDGLKFGANAPAAGKTDNPVGNKLNSTINIKGAGTKTLDQYSGQNLITSVEQDADGTTTIHVLMDRNISADGVTVGQAGKAGENGAAGTIGINGKDGKDGITTTFIRTEKGQPGKDGINGKPGVDGTDITRIVYQNGQDGTDGKDLHTVATLEDGLKFAGDDGQNDTTKVISKKLNEQLDIIGGAALNSLTDNNIGVKNEGGKLYVRLAKHVNLDADGTLKAGNLTIGAFSNTDLTTNKNNHPSAGSYATGLSNTDWNVADPEYVSGRAATEDQLAKLSQTITDSNTVRTDYQLVRNPNTDDGSYTATNGELTLTVRDTEHTNDPKYPDKTITIKDIASKTKVDEAYDRTVKYDMKDGKVDKTHVTFEAVDEAGNPVDTQVSHMASGASEITDDGEGNKTYTYNADNNAANIGDVKRLAAESELHYSGDTGTGTSQLKDTVAFNGTKGQIVTEATNGKVTFKLADDLTTQTITVTGKDGKDGQSGTPGHIGIDGKDGKSGIGIDGKDGISIKGENGIIGLSGKDGISVKGKDGKDGVTITGKDGVDGVNGAEGHIGLNGKDGMVDIWTKPGKPGVDGKDGETMTRIVYKNPAGQEHQGATLDDGLKFHGDSGDVVTRKLNTQLDVLGGQTDTEKLTATKDGNIGVVSTKAADENSNGKLEIRLAKELKNLTSVQTGDTTVDGDGLKIEKSGKDGKGTITINKTTVSIAGNQITNMGSGLGNTYTAAEDNNGANIGDVKKIADGRRTTVKSTDGSVSVVDKNANDPNATSHDYDLSVDTSKVAEGVILKYKGDNNTQGSNKLSEAVTFSGTEGQIVTQAEDGKVTFKLADDLTTQTITATGKNGNDGQIGLTGKDGADGKVTTIIKTVGAKGTDGKDGIPGVDGQPGKDGITRLIYQDGKDGESGTTTHVVATLDDGLKFVGNDGKVVARKLNDILSLKGGIDDPEVLADKSRVSRRNLGVRQNTAGDGLEIVMTNRPDFEAITVGPDSNPAHKITIGQQNNKDGNPNPTKGNYITGLDNTQWDAGNVVADRAATEGQLSQAITDISGKEKGGFGLADENGTTVKKDLGQTVTVKGDGKNIETKVNGDALEVSLKKDVNLGADGSVKAGNTTINNNGVDTNKVKVGDITITKDGINGGTKQITNIGSGIDGKKYADAKDNNAASIGDVKQIAGDEAGKAAEAVKSKSGKNITVKDDHTVNLNDNITLGDETDASKQVVIDGNGAKVTAGDGANKVTVDGSKGQVTIGSGDKTLTLGKQANTAGDSNPAEGNYLNGLDNTKWDGEHIQSGRAATEDQLKTVSDKVNSGRVFQGDDGKEVKVGMGDTLKIQGGVKAEDVSKENNIGIVKGADDTLNIRLAKDLKGLDSVTTGNTTINNGGLTVKTGDSTHQDITIQQGDVNMGGNKIEGVAPGKISKDSTDAVNGSQLYAADQAISYLGGTVNKLGTRVDRVGAGSAALAALHPLDFDPDDKWDFAAGYGHYRGANAAAVGAYYRPNEDTMFSIGGSFGGGENMFNAGVSIKLGQGNHISTSRVAMAKEMEAMRRHMAEQDALIAKLESMHGMAEGPEKSALFPDVAENHWAYQYVTTLAKKGILEGYPDGEFKGERMMTRYEFAAIVYRIVESGVGSTDPELSKLVREFSPELQYIRIDTIHRDDKGQPTVQRVRVKDRK